MSSDVCEHVLALLLDPCEDIRALLLRLYKHIALLLDLCDHIWLNLLAFI